MPWRPQLCLSCEIVLGKLLHTFGNTSTLAPRLISNNKPKPQSQMPRHFLVRWNIYQKHQAVVFSVISKPIETSRVHRAQEAEWRNALTMAGVILSGQSNVEK